MIVDLARYRETRNLQESIDWTRQGYEPVRDFAFIRDGNLIDAISLFLWRDNAPPPAA